MPDITNRDLAENIVVIAKSRQYMYATKLFKLIIERKFKTNRVKSESSLT
jgi:hypothetical protein